MGAQPSDPATHVAIGIPCYNRAAGLRQTIDCLRAQTHTNWTALIADNASPDPEVRAVAEAACAADARFRYLRRPENIGAEGNFHDVATRAEGAYFMWASDDDVWEPGFIEHCLGLLAGDPTAMMAFCSIDNVNSAGQTIRTYPGFSRFTSQPTLESAAAFLSDPEVMGKANLVYGLFRMKPFKEVLASTWEKTGFAEWGGDMVFVFGFLRRYPIIASDKVLLHKRIDTDDTALKLRRHRKFYFVPREHFDSYLRRHIAVSPTPQFAEMTKQVLRRRRRESQAFKYLSKLRLARFFD